MGGSPYGWLFTFDIDLKFGLLNPLMGKRYDLPPLPPIKNMVIRNVREATGDPREITYEDAQTGSVYKAILDHDPSQRSDFTVLILYDMLRRRIAFWRPGNLVWTIVEGNYCSFDDITHFKRKFYAIDFDYVAGVDIDVTYVVDVGPDPKVTRVAPEVLAYNHSRTYLVDFRGELLLLQMYRPEIEKDRLLTRSFIVYKLDLGEGKYYRRHRLDGYSIFLVTAHRQLLIQDNSPGAMRTASTSRLMSIATQRSTVGTITESTTWLKALSRHIIHRKSTIVKLWAPFGGPPNPW